MALTEGQIQVRSLVMGPGTAYEVLAGANPFSRFARSDGGGPRPRNHGSWAGPEFLAEAVVPLPILVKGDSAGEWLARHQRLQAAFRPVGPGESDAEFRFCVGGNEFIMFGRPRVVDPDPDTIGTDVLTRCAFVATNPRYYSAQEHSVMLTLPMVSGGLTAPLTVPFSIPATVIAGRTTIANVGTADAGLRLRIDGPVVEPRVATRIGSTTYTLRCFLTLDSGQWLEIDTAARTAYLNGTASRRGRVSWIPDWPVLPEGLAEIAFNASVYDPAAQLSASWRDAW